MIKKMIVMAIKPEYAKAIYEGKKHWEFRKAPPPLMEGILLYESAPVGMITGMVTFAFAIKSRPDWCGRSQKRTCGISAVPG